MDRVQQTLDALDTIRLGDQFLRRGELVVVAQINATAEGPNVFLQSEDGTAQGWRVWQLRQQTLAGKLTMFVPGPAVIRVRTRPGQTITRRRR